MYNNLCLITVMYITIFFVKLDTVQILLTSIWRKRIITRRYLVSKYHFVQHTLDVSNPGGDVIVRCTRKNVYLASCPCITEKLTIIQLSLEAWTFTGRYVSPTLHIGSSTLLNWFCCVGHAVMLPATKRYVVLTEINKLETSKFKLFE